MNGHALFDMIELRRAVQNRKQARNSKLIFVTQESNKGLSLFKLAFLYHRATLTINWFDLLHYLVIWLI